MILAIVMIIRTVHIGVDCFHDWGGGVIGVLGEGAKRPSGGEGMIPPSHCRTLKKMSIKKRMLEHLKTIFYEIKRSQNSRAKNYHEKLNIEHIQIVSPKIYYQHLGIDCERTLRGIWKIKPDYETITIFLQFSEDPIWFGQVVTKGSMDFW